MKKRYIILIALLLLILLTVNVGNLGPVRPFIQLPGEKYPGVPFFLEAGVINTFVAALLGYIILFLLPVFAKAGSRTPEEVPTGFYNFIEMLVEGAYGFVEGIAGEKAKPFFPFFFTFIMLVATVNLMALIPGYDSIGLWEYKPHFYAEKEIKTVETELKAAEDAGPEVLTETLAELEAEYGVPLEWTDGHLTEFSEEELLHHLEDEFDADNLGDLKNGALLQRAQLTADGDKPEDADWTIVPFVRPAATDLNFNLALALVSMTMVQVFGFRFLGAGYLKKFFSWPSGFIDTFAKDPMQGIILILQPVVGLIELVSEISKVISFSFRLLGAMFGGMVLLFVISALAPVANLAFFGLELFVGLIQALVFAMLSVIFMKGATESHHDDHH